MSKTKLKWDWKIDPELGDVYTTRRTAGGQWRVSLAHNGVNSPPLFSICEIDDKEKPINEEDVEFPTFLEADTYCAAENEKTVKEPEKSKEEPEEDTAFWWMEWAGKLEEEKRELQEKVSRLRERAIKAEASLRKIRLESSKIPNVPEDDNQ